VSMLDEKLEENLTSRLAVIATEIRLSAKGRTCSGCVHHRDGWCATQTNYSGDNLAVLYPNAVACAKHEVRI
jgi:hypothetical protein